MCVYANESSYIFSRMAQATSNHNVSNVQKNETPVNMEAQAISNHNASNVQENATPVNMEAVTMITKVVQEVVNACEYSKVSTIDKFIRLQPPTFVGGADPLVAEEWIARMEKTFKYVNCTEEEKVDFATFMLREDASNWWHCACGSLKNKGSPIGWEHFKTMFLDRYFPSFVRMEKLRELLRLKQGALTLAKYASQFERLLRVAPCTMSEDMKAFMFKQGLKPELLDALACCGSLETYSGVLTAAQVADHFLHKKDAESESTEDRKGKRSFQNGNDGNCSGNRKKGRVPTCYSCGEKGHRNKECPYNSQGT